MDTGQPGPQETARSRSRSRSRERAEERQRERWRSDKKPRPRCAGAGAPAARCCRRSESCCPASDLQHAFDCVGLPA